MGRSRSRQLRFATLVAVGTAVTMLASGCAQLAGEPELETVLIGATLELTGEGAELGAVYHNALQLRVEQINQQGLLGNRRLQLEVRDNRSDPSTAALNVGELAQNPSVVAVISGGCSACAIASAEVTNDQRVPMIALAPASGVSEPVDERQYVFKLAPNADHNAAMLAAQLAGAEVETIAVVAGTDAYGEDGEQEMSEAAERADLDVVVNTQVSDAEEETLQTAVSDIMAYTPAAGQPPDELPGVEPVQNEQPDGPDNEQPDGPDAVVVWAPAPVAAPFMVALREGGYDGPLYLDSIAADNLFLSGAAQSGYEGATLIFNESLVIDSVVATSPAKAARKTWFNAYSARYGTYHAFSSFAVDAVQLLVVTINRLDGAGREELRDGFERIQLDGVSGPLRITPTNHSGLTSLGLIPLVARSDRWQAAGS